MIAFIDFMTVLIPAILVLLLYLINYRLIIIRYVKRIAYLNNNGNTDEANKLIAIALKRQPKKMKRLFVRYGIVYTR